MFLRIFDYMKTRLILFAAIYIAMASSRVLGFDQLEDASQSTYVVIGAFAIRDHAAIWVERAQKMKFNAISAINPARHLYYVYVLRTLDREAAIVEAIKIRTGGPYSDTWVYTGTLGNQAVAAQGSDVNPTTGQPIVKVDVQDTTVETNPPLIQDKTPPVPAAVEGSKNFLFKIFVASNQNELAGDIDVIDVEKGKKVASYQGNQNVVLRPFNKTGNISLVCDVFGYRKMKHDLNFNQTQEKDGIVTEGTQTIVPFEMVRLVKGDLVVMYNVYFFKDAAIMQPESRAELTNLLTMMKENPNIKIKIHGHTNGSAHGKIISMGKSQKFFSLSDSKEGFGSAKKLSEERAKVIRTYLQAEGIDEKRMEIKAWGGKLPLYDKSSPQARLNVRVEVEITEDK